MEDYDSQKRIADSILQDAKSYVEHVDDDEVVILDDYYDELEKLQLRKEDKDLYRVRLDFLLYSEQY